jgi:hypothetical protein
MTVKKPIFIVSAGRSGSTVFHRLLGYHPNVAWLSPLVDRYPSRPGLNRFWMHALEVPVIGAWMAERYLPDERYLFWEHHSKGFRVPFRDLRASDVTPSAKRALREALGRVVTTRRPRLMTQITGWPRMGFLREVFPDAKFIHVLRDGRAVASSLLTMPWWWGWRGPSNWRFGPLPAAEQAEWERRDRSFVALAAIQWKLTTEAVDRAPQDVSEDDFLEIKYEELCAEPVTVLNDVIRLCELETHPAFEAAIRRFPMKSANEKWKTDLTVEQQEILQEVLCTRLASYGYSVQ